MTLIQFRQQTYRNGSTRRLTVISHGDIGYYLLKYSLPLDEFLILCRFGILEFLTFS